ncbi:MAG: class I SAM-dependent methyltransferase [Candidatus Thiodiazotropha sp.]|jgi:2-polyprenyl-3-methyl-5-hydroxy-6-metoxy-1,4-benzoquinol methylase
MHSDYSIYDSLYEQARTKGWQGWGGDARIATGPSQVERILAKSYVPKSGKVLDLGCGEGHLSRLLAAHGYLVTGVDVSETAIAWALEKEAGKRTVTYIRGNLCQSGVLAGEFFDLIVDGNCLHCILGDDRPLFLRNVLRLLSYDGVFFVSSLCSKDDLSVTLMHMGYPYRYVPSRDRLLFELENSGFQVLAWDEHERKGHNHINIFTGKRG